MFSLRILVGFFLVFYISSSCTEKQKYQGAENEIVFTNEGSPYHIHEDIIVDSTKKLVILPGSKLIFHDTAEIIIHGGLFFMGNENDPITLKPFKSDSLWGGIRILRPKDSCIIKGTIIKNGLIFGEDANVRISDSKFYNNYELEKFNALVRLFRGSVGIKNSFFESNHTGEGILIHKTKNKTTVVENCEFQGVSDAVEYLNVFKGLIRGNKFYNIQQELGDAIDLNGCKGIRIENNLFDDVRDFGIEAGNDKYGPSRDILISRNIFVNCFKGVVVKGGSNAVVLNNTFHENDFAISCMGEDYGSNYNPNQIEAINSIFSNSINNDFLNNENSTIIFGNCLSDRRLLEGDENIYDDPGFVSAKNGDFRLSDDSPCIGVAQQYIISEQEIQCVDIGAICYEKN